DPARHRTDADADGPFIGVEGAEVWIAGGDVGAGRADAEQGEGAGYAVQEEREVLAAERDRGMHHRDGVRAEDVAQVPLQGVAFLLRTDHGGNGSAGKLTRAPG